MTDTAPTEFDPAKLRAYHEKRAAAEGATVGTNVPTVDFDSALRRLEELGNEALRRKGDFAEWFSAQPQASTCRKHGGAVQRDFEASWLETCKHDQRRVVFSRCPVCVVEQANAKQSAWLTSVGVPKLYLLESFDTYKPDNDRERENLKSCREFADRPHGTLFMHGLTGTGKSHLCVSIVRAVGRGRYRTHEMLLEGLRAGYGNHGAKAAFDRLKDTPLLVWDEFGVSVSGADDAMMIHSILNHRHEEKLPTVIATNLTVPDFKALVGERIESRMRQSLAHKLTFDGADRRNDMKARYLANL